MAHLVLVKILNSQISPEEVIDWLTDITEDTKWAEINNAKCTRTEFILYFLNFLRDQCVGVLQVSSVTQIPKAKKIVLLTDGTSDDTSDKLKDSQKQVPLIHHCEQKIFKRENTVKDTKKEKLENQAEGVTLNIQGNVSPKYYTGNLTSKNLKSPSHNSNSQNSSTKEHQKHNLCNRPLESSVNVVGISKSSNGLSLSVNAVTSTPVIKKSNRSTEHLSKKTAELSATSCFSENKQEGIKSSNKLSNDDESNLLIDISEYDSCHKEFLDTKSAASTFNDFDLSSYSTNQSGIINCSSINGNKDWCNNSDSSSMSINASRNTSKEQLNSSAPSRFKNSVKDDNSNDSSLMSSDSNQNPSTPLRSSRPASSKSNKKLYSRCSEGQRSLNNSPQQTTFGTPARHSNSSKKYVKVTPKQHLSLGDFISVDSHSKKSSSKKSNARMELLRQNDGENQMPNNLYVTDETFPEVGKTSNRRRRINPTRLDISDGKGNKENVTFGIISRPSTVNPQFLEALASDKLSDKISFEEERCLLRLERQKQPKNVLPNENNNRDTLCQVMPKFSSKRKSSVSLEVPNLELVDNVKILNLLVKLYCGFISNGFVANPMSELYFIISLITAQFTVRSNPNPIYSKKEITQNMKEEEKSIAEMSNEKSTLSINCSASHSVFGTDKLEATPANDSNDSELKLCSPIKILRKSNDERKSLDPLSDPDLGCAVLKSDCIEPIDLEVSAINNMKSQLIEANENIEKLSLDSQSMINMNKNASDISSTNYIEEKNVDNHTKKRYLRTIHNCAYFSTNVLNNQRTLLNILDRTTLKLLLENNIIGVFKPELKEYVNKLYDTKLSVSIKVKEPYNFSILEKNVCFQKDTDNRDNFPSETAFHTFRRQRDMFYQILKIWEENHLKEGWTFSVSLGAKIKSLLTVHNDAVNYFHFARLFKSQLLTSGIQNGHQEDGMDDESLDFLKSLKHLNPEKLTQLRERLVTPMSSKGPVPRPSFPGVQEFFKDFILHAFNPIFYVHLENCLVHEIIELNDTQFAESDIADTETMVDEGTKQTYITCLSSLRLLAKMLGFLTSLPYRSTSGSLEEGMTSQIEVRSRVLPALDLQFCLQNAVLDGKFSLTIPWAVKYLTMMDSATLHLPYYMNILEFLYLVYRACSNCNVTESGVISQQTALLVKFSLGWLFEQPNFPKDLYYAFQSNLNHDKMKSLFHPDKKEVPSPFYTSGLTSTSIRNCTVNLDKLDIIDDRAIYICCPFLSEVKIILASGNTSSSSTTIRHITPVSSQLPKSSSSSSTKHLEMQLEEAFFRGQPTSTRRVVDFVAERIGSTCVKHISNSLLPPAREKSLTKFREVVNKKRSEIQSEQLDHPDLPEKFEQFDKLESDEPESDQPDELELDRPERTDVSEQSKLLNKEIQVLRGAILKEGQVTTIATTVAKEFKDQCGKMILPICKTRVNRAIEALLPEDTLLPVKEICVKIVTRMAMERINQWTQSYVAGGSLFIKDMEAELGKMAKMKSPVQFEERVHNVNAASPTSVIDELRSYIWDMLENNGQSLTLESISSILKRLSESLEERIDLQPGPERVLCLLSIDFALFLAAYRVDLFTTKIQDLLIKVWKIQYFNASEIDSALSRIFSPRNVMLLAQSGNNKVWSVIGQFVRRLLKEHVLFIETLSNQCVALLRQEWPHSILENLSKCLDEGIMDYESSDAEAGKIRCLLLWIADTYREMECCND
ncbi:uncharacterized protein LOC105700032 [Orussus abietinus]|uniref:uncharacterized protein LOC105700032 n=1 Tax=Orussus abietinus TaxID=222816 RepID=UPI0006260775|nr:uncharacterized protein LOC105700032 [Orussus abietinus]XP_012280997.1 uncharacterized protein LOC105700032 [Orussus abietinus]XP_023290687.1 uncharacterized protein LOC105700032 [Orussus abietinus]